MRYILDTDSSQRIQHLRKDFPRREITFIGPSEECLRLLGDKIAARKSMSEAGIPIARGTEKRSLIIRKLSE